VEDAVGLPSRRMPLQGVSVTMGVYDPSTKTGPYRLPEDSCDTKFVGATVARMTDADGYTYFSETDLQKIVSQAKEDERFIALLFEKEGFTPTVQVLEAFPLKNNNTFEMKISLLGPDALVREASDAQARGLADATVQKAVGGISYTTSRVCNYNRGWRFDVFPKGYVSPFGNSNSMRVMVDAYDGKVDLGIAE